MKKLLIGCITLFVTTQIVGCGHGSHDGTYFASERSEYSVAEDTITINGNIVTNRVGYRRILDGRLQPKKWSVKKWILNDPYSPIIEMGDNQIAIGSTVYKKIGQ
ncbi:MAG: hypothetical protein JST50_02530 [Bacteroidetes bacterium]|nr:hypothetical protein [Bacteroidota bacterium]